MKDIIITQANFFHSDSHIISRTKSVNFAWFECKALNHQNKFVVPLSDIDLSETTPLHPNVTKHCFCQCYHWSGNNNNQNKVLWLLLLYFLIDTKFKYAYRASISKSPQNIINTLIWGRDKMAAILQMTFLNAFSWIKISEFRVIFHWNLFLIDNKSALVLVMACCLFGTKPLSKPMVTQFTDTYAYMRH